jgi:hypothetical protein
VAGKEGSYIIQLINGFPQGPNALIVPNGSISFSLNVDATVVAAPYGFVCADIPVVFQFDATGALIQPAKLWSNAELNPQLSSTLLGTYYLVTFYDQDGARLNKSPMWWQFPEAANATVDISGMVPYATVGGNVIFYPTSFAIGSIPTPSLTTLGGIFANAGLLHEVVIGINTDGTLAFGFLPPPTLTTLGGVFANAGVAGQFITAINTDGTVTLGTPTGSITGTISANQIAFGSASNILAGSANFTWTNSTQVLNIIGKNGSGNVVILDASALVGGTDHALTIIKADSGDFNVVHFVSNPSTGNVDLQMANGQFRINVANGVGILEIDTNILSYLTTVSGGQFVAGCSSNSAGFPSLNYVFDTALLRIGGLILSQVATPTTITGQIGFGTTLDTSATAGSNGDVPAQVVGYLVFDIAGTKFKLPYYAA